MKIEKIKEKIENLDINNPSKEDVEVIEEAIKLLDAGHIRVAESINNEWVVNEWVKNAILHYFVIKKIKNIEAGEVQYFDKFDPKKNYEELNIRVVPPGAVRYGAFCEPGVVVMPGFVNIGAYVGSGTMVDTWATVGSCAQIGKDVHLSGGVGIGGVLEPIQSNPVIIEDNAFIGSRSIIVEGVKIEKEAVLGANVVITSSTKIIDVSNKKPIEYQGIIPARSVVIPGNYTKKFSAGDYGVPCALIIGKRKKSTDKKTSLNNALRDYNLSV